MKVGQMGEEAIIGALASLGCTGALSGETGVGDDCAIIPAGQGRVELITTDLLVEGVHFRREWTTPEDLGRKALAVNLSDVAAMGGMPSSAFLSLALPPELERAWLERLFSGMDALAMASGTALLGGDTTRSPGPLVINFTVLGHAMEAQVKRRDGARPGDLICVTGALGDAAAGLRLLQEELAATPSEDEAQLLAALHRPHPHLEAGQRLAASPGVHAMMDLSDGLATDLARLMKASGCGARVELEALPVSGALARVATDHGWDAAELAAAGGEEYCLLFTVAPDAAEEAGAIVVGEVLAGEGVSWVRGGAAVRLSEKGFNHFAHHGTLHGPWPAGRGPCP